MFKTIEISYENAAILDEGYIVFTTKASNLKDKDIPLNANPRKPTKANKNVKLMIEQLEADPKNFRKKNEGISIIANKAVIDKDRKVVIFEVNIHQGIINGGHTYYVLNKYGIDSALVRIEVNTGVPDNLTVDIASARNSSKKLAIESELHHDGLFEWVKESISTDLKDDICFFEGDEGCIPIGELLQVANIICPGKKTIENAKRSYNSKGAILTSLKNNKMSASIVKTRRRIEDMWDLYNYIRSDEELRERFLPIIYADDLMYKGVAFYILAGVLQKRVEVADGYMNITIELQQIKDIIAMKASDINNRIMKLGQHFVGAIDSMVASDTFVDGIRIVFLDD
ncbi:AIPR family protein [Clostridium estertheticum]|uniref:AIPR family protein n=1 Tax=Clostridium estertheticum TaxID=238834 RepID=UPI001C0C11D5|nr:AIPR family protein [Clostridium estertheticum]MBU3072527.1 AIPR family protein [Clostridium estertheticum]MBU3162620.1 AIPR family protein [Clostridium estertheticum]